VDRDAWRPVDPQHNCHILSIFVGMSAICSHHSCISAILLAWQLQDVAVTYTVLYCAVLWHFGVLISCQSSNKITMARGYQRRSRGVSRSRSRSHSSSSSSSRSRSRGRANRSLGRGGKRRCRRNLAYHMPTCPPLISCTRVELPAAGHAADLHSTVQEAVEGKPQHEPAKGMEHLKRFFRDPLPLVSLRNT